MALLPIKIFGESILREKAVPITNLDGKLADFLQDMTLTMRTANGLGLAANQVGKAIRAFTVDLSHFDVTEEPKVFINPVIMETGGVISGEEGCLSFPGLFQVIERPEKVTIKSISLDGREYFYEAQGLLARVILHEIDHLDGILFIDKLGAAQRKLIKGKLEKIKANSVEQE